MEVVPESSRKNPTIAYRQRQNETIRLPDGWKLINVEVEVEGLREDSPVVKLDQLKSHAGVYRMATLTVQPLGEIFNVVWDGNLETPSFRFDMWPDVARMLISLWGR